MLYVTIEILRIAAILLQPIMPASMEQAARSSGRARAAIVARTFAAARATGAAAGAPRRAASARAGQGAAGALRHRSSPAYGSSPKPAVAVTLIDSHCHLDFPDFAERVRRGHRAGRAPLGSRRMITIGTRVEKAARLIEIAERYDSVYLHRRNPSA